MVEPPDQPPAAAAVVQHHHAAAPRKARWGLLSTARVNRHIVSVLKDSPLGEVVAVASRGLDAAQRFAVEHGIPKAYGSYAELLRDPDVDAVYVSLPNHLHKEWTIKALEHRKHVLCEKPLATSADDAAAMFAAAAKYDRVVTEGFMFAHTRQFQHVRETLKYNSITGSSTIGRLVTLRGQFGFPLARTGHRTAQSPKAGGGSLWDVGCYLVAFARLLLGEEPYSVSGTSVVPPHPANQHPGDVSFFGTVVFPHNIVFQFEASFEGPERMSFEIVGTDGMIRLPNPFKPRPQGDSFSVQRNTGPLKSPALPPAITDFVIAEPPGVMSLYSEEVFELCRVVLGELEVSAVRLDAKFSTGNARVVEALQSAAAKGEVVFIAPDDAEPVEPDA